MAKRPMLGLFQDANAAANAGDGLKPAGISENDYDFLTSGQWLVPGPGPLTTRH